MKNLQYLLSISILFSVLTSQAQPILKWDGGGGDGNWATPANWTGDRLPDSSDQVVLDHEFISASYRVSMPSGAKAIRIASLRISASIAAPIELMLPASNTLAPAFIVEGSNGIQLETGALLRNASGASNGNSISVFDSLYLFNGAAYYHETETAHAALLNKLSRREATRNGRFVFNVPGNASYTVSASNRNYGALQFSAKAAGGSKNYLSTGANPLLIRSELQIDSGVTYALNLSAPVQVEGDCRIDGQLNLSSGAISGQLQLKRDLLGTGRLTETGTASALVDFNGTSLQRVRYSGLIQQQVALQLNNAAGLRLLQPVFLPYQFRMQQGVVYSSDTALLTLGPSCILVADSTAAFQYVDGPLCRELQDSTRGYLFPIGNVRQRWVSIKNAGGRFTLRYQKSNPLNSYPYRDSSIDHVSSLEYWTLQTDSIRNATIELSFDHVNSGGVTDLNSLRVARLMNNRWTNAGNTAFTGSAGAAGSVSSQLQVLTGGQPEYFSLAALSAGQNPLPLQPLELRVQAKPDHVLLAGMLLPDVQARLRYEYSTGGAFRLIHEVQGSSPVAFYPPASGNYRFRVAVIWPDGHSLYSAVVSYYWKEALKQTCRVWPVPASQYVWMDPGTGGTGLWQASWYSIAGVLMKKETLFRQTALLQWDGSSLPPGSYLLQVVGPTGKRLNCRVVLQ